ncbi:helix-turn-helix domain-containing protein [Acetobacter lambici]|uniref:Helix-turn-helix domain-containing protein n=1 Tax=Acetobacter lambici TaxID=1332824 RepID=A0ABT1F458_9PROT|nr:helix-turn-helix domain-containing protein [Acetobacter lambici]MCP1243866.1 helix-turn-helix domain-containing protein [Acetobacter lambici]MCP1259985.1 helix-turn-helix domain-containing protein [Acetobacter lambici]
MTPERLKECLELIGWSQHELAKRVEADKQLVSEWVLGTSDIPASIAAWLETLGQIHAKFPNPKSWRRAP